MSQRSGRPGAVLLGADGCRQGGWMAVVQHQDGDLAALHLPTTPALFAQIRTLRPEAAILDIPIGLADSGSRECDRQARRVLSPRGSCVFPAPPRSVLSASSRAEADRLWRRADGRGCSAQTFGLLPRIREVDRALTRRLSRVVAEGHPELSFQEMAEGRRLPSKYSTEGREIRVSLLVDDFPEVGAWLGRHRQRQEDLLDSCACLWTARRVVAHAAVRLPSGEPPRDRRGLPMVISY